MARGTMDKRFGAKQWFPVPQREIDDRSRDEISRDDIHPRGIPEDYCRYCGWGNPINAGVCGFCDTKEWRGER